jgi:hypothetical protein
VDVRQNLSHRHLAHRPAAQNRGNAPLDKRLKKELAKARLLRRYSPLMMNNGRAALQRYIPLACWIAVLLTALFICLKIIGYGYLPPGDARRHAAKPFAGKPYSQIVIMRPEYVVDHSPGWEWLLGLLHRAFGWNEDALISFSLASLILWIFCLPLIWLRRPEAWLAAILAQMIAIPELMTRFTQARPYLVTEGVLMALLFSWSNAQSKNPPWWKLLLTSAGFALAIWMHGIWYFWILLLAAFFLAQRWRQGLWLTVCWAAGTLAAGLLTGKPVSFLYEAVFQASLMYREHLPKWMLVGELQSSEGEFASLTLLALVYLWLKLQNKVLRPLFLQPVFWMIAMNWVLGFMADRFWADWGMPAALVWMAMQFDDTLPAIAAEGSLKRLILCAMIALPLFLDATNDLGRRYTFSNAETFLDAGDPNLNGWLPEKDGVFYSDDMRFFFNAFYKNPAAPWRYMVGFEPALMLPDDLKVYRAIQRNRRDPGAYEPWIKKMRSEDRFAIESLSQPNLPSLEWTRSGDCWIGRLPLKNANGARH